MSWTSVSSHSSSDTISSTRHGAPCVGQCFFLHEGHSASSSDVSIEVCLFILTVVHPPRISRNNAQLQRFPGRQPASPPLFFFSFPLCASHSLNSFPLIGSTTRPYRSAVVPGRAPPSCSFFATALHAAIKSAFPSLLRGGRSRSLR